MEQLEETIAHLTRSLDDLSDVVARQDVQIRALETRVAYLSEQEKARAEAGGGGHVFGSEKPPHY